MKNFFHIFLLFSLTVIGVLHLHLHPLCVMAYPRTPIPYRKMLKDTLVHVYNNYGEGSWRWSPEMFLGDAHSG